MTEMCPKIGATRFVCAENWIFPLFLFTYTRICKPSLISNPTGCTKDWPLRLSARTSGSHPGKRSSTLLGAAKGGWIIIQNSLIWSKYRKSCSTLFVSSNGAQGSGAWRIFVAKGDARLWAGVTNCDLLEMVLVTARGIAALFPTRDWPGTARPSG